MLWARGEKKELRMNPIFLGCKNGRKGEPVTEEENTEKGADLWEN